MELFSYLGVKAAIDLRKDWANILPPLPPGPFNVSKVGGNEFHRRVADLSVPHKYLSRLNGCGFLTCSVQSGNLNIVEGFVSKDALRFLQQVDRRVSVYEDSYNASPEKWLAAEIHLSPSVREYLARRPDALKAMRKNGLFIEARELTQYGDRHPADKVLLPELLNCMRLWKQWQDKNIDAYRNVVNRPNINWNGQSGNDNRPWFLR